MIDSPARLVCLMLATSAAALAQTTNSQLVLPAAARGVEAASHDPDLVGEFHGRTQLVIDRAQLGAFTTTPIRRIAFRRDVTLNETLPKGFVGGWIDLEIYASWTKADARAPSAAFAHNRGSSPQLVYKGAYQVPSSPKLASTVKVASFDPKISANIVLQSPIQVAKSGNLCLEIVTRPTQGKKAPQSWIVDAHHERLTSSVVHFGDSCWRNVAGPEDASIAAEHLVVGSSLLAFTTGPKVGPALLFVGASKTRFGAFPLPIDLGILGATGCKLYVSNEIVAATLMQSYAGYPIGEARIDLPLPVLPQIMGLPLHSQWLFFTPGRNRLGLSTSNGATAVIAPKRPSLGIAMIKSYDDAAATGRVYVDRAPVFQLASR